jgi:hypothetical protein
MAGHQCSSDWPIFMTSPSVGCRLGIGRILLASRNLFAASSRCAAPFASRVSEVDARRYYTRCGGSSESRFGPPLQQ